MFCPECGGKCIYDSDTDTYDCLDCGDCWDEDDLIDEPKDAENYEED